MSAITRLDVLHVLGDFDRTGGGSMELIAWELLTEPSKLKTVWDVMMDEGLLREAGEDEFTGETMFRLTSVGWSELRGADLRTRRESS